MGTKAAFLDVATYDPKVCEFDSAQQANSHTEWLRHEINTRRNDVAIGVPHRQVMERMDALLNKFPLHLH